MAVTGSVNIILQVQSPTVLNTRRFTSGLGDCEIDGEHLTWKSATHDLRVKGSIHGKSSRTTLFPRVNFLCWLLFWHRFYNCVTTVGYSQTHKHPWNRKVSGRTVTSRQSVETHQGNELKCNSLGNARSQLSQLAQPLWTNPWPKRVEFLHTS